MYWIPLLTILGTLVPILTRNWSRTACATATAILPAVSLILVLFKAPEVFSGATLVERYTWVEQLGLEIAFRLDSYALLFTLLILGIGLLIILYARYYLSANDNIVSIYDCDARYCAVREPAAAMGFLGAHQY